MQQEQELLELEQAFWAASGDAEAYRRRFAEDGICVFSFGMLDKATTIRAIESAEPWVSVALHDVAVVPLAPQAVALTYAATASRADGHPYEANVTSVYAEREGSWQLVVHHQTPRTTPS